MPCLRHCLQVILLLVAIALPVSSVKFIVERIQNEAPEPSNSVVTRVNASNFDLFMRKQPLLIEFYAPWCRHCVEFSPLLDSIAEILRLETVPIKVGKVDVGIEKALAGRFGVDSIPAVFLYRKNRVYRYNGPLVVDEVVDWAKQGYRKQPSLSYLKSPMSAVGVIKGTSLYTIVPNISEQYQLSPFMAVMLLVGGTAIGFLLFTFVYIMLSVAHAKSD